MNTQPWQVSITGRHLSLTEGVKQYASRKLEHLRMDFPFPVHAYVVLDIQKYLQRCCVILSCAHGLRFQARCESESMYASIDGCMEKLARQIEKYHMRRRHFHQHLKERQHLLKNHAFRPSHHGFPMNRASL